MKPRGAVTEKLRASRFSWMLLAFLAVAWVRCQQVDATVHAVAMAPEPAGSAALAEASIGLISAWASSDREDLSRPAEADTTIITLYSYGTTLAFEPDFFSVEAGTTVTVRYVNEATIAHNFVVAREEADIDVLGVAAFDAAETGFVPLELEDRMIAHSALADPGKTVEVTFTAPPPGDYYFVCLVDGHFNIMVGTMRTTG